MLSSVILPAAISFVQILINFTGLQSGKTNWKQEDEGVASHASNRVTYDAQQEKDRP